MTNPILDVSQGQDPRLTLQHRLNQLQITADMTPDQVNAVAAQAISLQAQFAKVLRLKANYEYAQQAYDGFVAAIKGLDKTYCAQQFNCTTDFVMQTLQNLIDRNAQKVAGIKGIYEAATVFPVASFTTPSNAIASGDVVTFTDTSTGSPVTWAWDFGDGVTDATESPQHVYSTPGTYTVTLVVTNTVGSGQPVMQTITVS